jgi:hypothetical protein
MIIRSAVLVLLLCAGAAIAQETGQQAQGGLDIPLPMPRPDPATLSSPASAPPAEDSADPADPESVAAPQADPAGEVDEAEEVEEGAEPLVPLPRPRPEPDSPDGDADAPAGEPDATGGDEGEAEPAPEAPPRIYQSACPAVISGAVIAQSLPPIAEGACGEQSPLSVTGVVANGRQIDFTSPATTSCAMATALPEWIAEIDRYAEARENSGIAEVITGTSYMCRNVNNATGGNLSFHAFANALDVTGFVLEDGRRITLPSGWLDAASPEGRLLRFAHSSACARFTTTLGPEANALHRDHLHVDMGCHGGRCTSRLCE